MIEISSPIQANNSPEANAENPVSAPLFGADPKKKGKPGAFSALLEGLTGKSRVKTRGTVNSKGSPNQAGGAGEISEGKTEKKTLLTRKTAVSPAETGIGEQVFSIFPQNSKEKAAAGAGETEPGALDFQISDISAAKLKEGEEIPALPAEGDLLNFPFEEEPHISVALKPRGQAAEAGNQVPEAEIPENDTAFSFEEKDATGFTALAEAVEGRRKNSRGAVDLIPASARNAENEVFRFSGEKRPGLVDILAGLSNDSAENKDGLNLRETRGKRKGGRFSLEVRDLRSSENSLSTETSKNPLNAAFSSERIDAEIAVELRPGANPQEGGGEIFSGKGGFEEALSRELGSHLSGDIVREASLILRDGGEGVIRLSLKPETLGNVKIRLEMTENKITGHIVVESSEAFKAFERELPVLEKQFQDSGFGEAKLDMSFAGEGSYYGSEGRENSGEAPRFSQIFAASRYDAESERQALSAEASGGSVEISAPQNAVNMLV